MERISYSFAKLYGGADRSYGIQVARLAGVPDEVLVRAREIADLLEAKDANSNLSKLTDLSEKDLKGGTEAMTQLSILIRWRRQIRRMPFCLNCVILIYQCDTDGCDEFSLQVAE